MRTAIVTGVSRGLGEALVAELLAHDWQVVGLARTTPTRVAHGSYRFVRCDLADTCDARRRDAPAFDAIAARAPEAVCLINNAATIDGVGVLGALAPADIATQSRVNLVAPTVLSNLFCDVFADDAIERRIINVSSGAAESTLAGESLYCIAKAGLEMLTRSLAAEHTSGRFRAITVRPGIIDTAMQAFARTQSKTTLPSVDLFKDFHASGDARGTRCRRAQDRRPARPRTRRARPHVQLRRAVSAWARLCGLISPGCGSYEDAIADDRAGRSGFPRQAIVLREAASNSPASVVECSRTTGDSTALPSRYGC